VVVENQDRLNHLCSHASLGTCSQEAPTSATTRELPVCVRPKTISPETEPWSQRVRAFPRWPRLRSAGVDPEELGSTSSQKSLARTRIGIHINVSSCKCWVSMYMENGGMKEFLMHFHWRSQTCNIRVRFLF
jgi:hypothetical protein